MEWLMSLVISLLIMFTIYSLFNYYMSSIYEAQNKLDRICEIYIKTLGILVFVSFFIFMVIVIKTLLFG